MILRQEYKLATAEDFGVISDLPSHRGKLVHVEGWARGYQFVYATTLEKGEHILITPRTGRKYKTSNRLLFIRDRGIMVNEY